MTSFITTILVAVSLILVSLVMVSVIHVTVLRLTRSTIELICESIHNLSQAIFASKQMRVDLEYNRNQNNLRLNQAEVTCNLNQLQTEAGLEINKSTLVGDLEIRKPTSTGTLEINKLERRIELKRMAKEARAAMWARSDIEVEVVTLEGRRVKDEDNSAGTLEV